MIRTAPRTRPQRRGTILIVAMLVVFALASLVVSLCRSVRVETMASANLAASVQAAAVERGAEQYVLALLEQEQEAVGTLTEDYFAGIQIGDGYFWILRPDYDDDTLPVFGLVEESGKLNINTAGIEQMLRMPAMTEDLAAGIVDWRDENEDVSTYGAESEYYRSLPEPYMCKNAPFETVEELLLVRGATREILYGERSPEPLGVVSSARSTGRPLFGETQFARGLYDLLTVYSVEPNTAADGSQRVNITDRNQRNRLGQLLQQQLGNTRGNEVLNRLGSATLRDVFDLHFRGRLTADELNKIADYITTSGDRQLRGRININTAPRDVLLCLGALEEGDVDRLLAQRRSAVASNPTGIAWVAEALGEKAVGLGSRITTRAYQYSADILAVSGNGRGFKRCRIVVDMQSGTPRIIYRRDLTDRGWPMDPQILAALRAGEGPGAWAMVAGSTPGGMFR